MRRRRSLFAALILLAAISAPFSARAQPASPPARAAVPGAPGVTAASAILVGLQDPATGAASSDGGRMLFGRGVHVERPPASLTKIVTALVARDHYGLDEIVTSSPLVLQTHGSDLGLRPGVKISVRDLLYSLLLKSANDAAMALAAHHPFGYEHFIQLMNEKARSLGAYDTRLRNPHGLDQIGHVSSAWDIALFGRQLLADPVLARIVATRSYRFRWETGKLRIFDNHNKLLNRYPDAIGMKTGFTDLAGHCLVAAARTPDGVMLTVVLASQDHYADSIGLIEYGKALAARVGSGGGGVDVGRPLGALPQAPPEALPLSPAGRAGLDPRDDIRWLIVMLVLAGLAGATIGVRRRSDPLGDAAGVHAWLESLVPPSERR